MGYKQLICGLSNMSAQANTAETMLAVLLACLMIGDAASVAKKLGNMQNSMVLQQQAGILGVLT